MNIARVRFWLCMPQPMRDAWSRQHLPEGDSIDAALERWERYLPRIRMSYWSFLASVVLLVLALLVHLFGGSMAVATIPGILVLLSLIALFIFDERRQKASIPLVKLQATLQEEHGLELDTLVERRWDFEMIQRDTQERLARASAAIRKAEQEYVNLFDVVCRNSIALGSRGVLRIVDDDIQDRQRRYDAMLAQARAFGLVEGDTRPPGEPREIIIEPAPQST